jgi:hypothetical protein
VTEKVESQRQNKRRDNCRAKGWQWQDKRNSNGRGKSENGRIRGVAMAEKMECQRQNNR